MSLWASFNMSLSLRMFENPGPGVKYTITLYLPIISRYDNCNTKCFTIKLSLIIHLKINCHVRIGITPSKIMVYAEFYSGFLTSNHGKILHILWFGRGLFIYLKTFTHLSSGMLK